MQRERKNLNVQFLFSVCMCVCVCVCVVAGLYENVKKNKVCQEIPVFSFFLFPVAIFISVP